MKAKIFYTLATAAYFCVVGWCIGDLLTAPSVPDHVVAVLLLLAFGYIAYDLAQNLK